MPRSTRSFEGGSKERGAQPLLSQDESGRQGSKPNSPLKPTPKTPKLSEEKKEREQGGEGGKKSGQDVSDVAHFDSLEPKVATSRHDVIDVL